MPQSSKWFILDQQKLQTIKQDERKQLEEQELNKQRYFKSLEDEQNKIKQQKLERLNILRQQYQANEPSAHDTDAVLIAFRKPSGNDKIQRRFLKSDTVQKLYDFIDSHPDYNAVGFDIMDDNEIPEYELVMQAYPAIVKIIEKEKTLEYYGINKNSLINIKQIS